MSTPHSIPLVHQLPTVQSGAHGSQASSLTVVHSIENCEREGPRAFFGTCSLVHMLVIPLTLTQPAGPEI